MERRYFYGNEVSQYGVEHGFVDYRCFAKCFNAVLNNDIMQKTYDIGYWEMVSGMVDNSEEIDELNFEIASINFDLEFEEFDEEEIEELEEKIYELEKEIEELEDEQNYEGEIFQYYIVSDNAVRLLEEANEIVYYNEELDMYVWGVTHYGTSWDYVLTNIKLGA